MRPAGHLGVRRVLAFMHSRTDNGD